MEEGKSAFKILTYKRTGKRPLGRPGIDGRTPLKWILKKCVNMRDWIDSAQNRDYLKALVKAALNFMFP